MTLPTRYLEIQKTSGVHLDQINVGSCEVAFTRDVALEALQSLNDTPVAVLGGDVLRISSGKLEYVYANWYCNKVEYEGSLSYAERSRCKAMSYVKDFLADGFEPLFVFVLSDIK
jgi:hypothetical protein